jgi:hypothetical protein
MSKWICALLAAAVALMAVPVIAQAAEEESGWCEPEEVACFTGEGFKDPVVIKGTLVGSVTAVVEKGPTITCTVSTTEDEYANPQVPGKNKPVFGEFKAMAFDKCTTNGGKTMCTITANNLTWSSEALGSGKGDGNGTVTVTKNKNGDPGLTTSCVGEAACSFTEAKAVFNVVAGKPATMEASKTVFKGAKCPKVELTAKWSLMGVNGIR